MQTRVEKFFNYLGFSNTSINEMQLIKLICLLGLEKDIVIKPVYNEGDLLNQVLNIYIERLETNTFNVLTEGRIVEELCLII